MLETPDDKIEPGSPQCCSTSSRPWSPESRLRAASSKV